MIIIFFFTLSTIQYLWQKTKSEKNDNDDDGEKKFSHAHYSSKTKTNSHVHIIFFSVKNMFSEEKGVSWCWMTNLVCILACLCVCVHTVQLEIIFWSSKKKKTNLFSQINQSIETKQKKIYNWIIQHRHTDKAIYLLCCCHMNKICMNRVVVHKYRFQSINLVQFNHHHHYHQRQKFKSKI